MRKRRVLVLGGTGMLGHKIVQVLKEAGLPVAYASRRHLDVGPLSGVQYFPINVGDVHSLVRSVKQSRADVIINCIGIVKQQEKATPSSAMIEVNTSFPHLLYDICCLAGTRLIHISTDCVFSGRRGAYRETDEPDASDLYGRSKLLGEVTGDSALTFRTSIIGRELLGSQGLLEWFLSQEVVSGFARAIFSGLTTLEFSRFLLFVIQDQPKLSGLYHVASEPISKYDLLERVRAQFSLQTKVVPVAMPIIDRSLSTNKLVEECGWIPPKWNAMLTDLYNDFLPYTEWRSRRI